MSQSVADPRIASSAELRPVLAAVERARSGGSRREGERLLAPGRKAQRTRARLVDAARTCFAERGYQGAAVGDIAAAAEVSLGTFYQYFTDRADVLAVVAGEWMVASMARNTYRWRFEDGIEGLERVLEPFVSDYHDSPGFMGAWEEASHVDRGIANLRRDLGRFVTEGLTRALARARRRGELDPEFDVAGTSRALAAMVDRHCFVTYIFDPPDPVPTVEETVRLLADLWAAALGIER